MGNKSKNKSVPKYPNGGNFKNIAKNWALGQADAALGMFGASNVIKDDQYVGDNAQKWANYANLSGKIGGQALKIGANIVAPGIGGAVVGGAQSIGGAFNPQDPSQYDQYGNPKNEKMQNAYGMINALGSAAGQAQSIGLFPMGGINMQPNAEIESQENVVAPNGGFLQADGPTHAEGGVPVNIPGNSMIFSDRLKEPGSKKTFAQLNKPNNTNKEDKILSSDKHGTISKNTAELMKLAKNKNSENLFAAQEALKQAKIAAYAKKLGVDLSQQSQTQTPQFPNGGLTGDPIKDFLSQRFNSNVLPSKVKKYTPEGRDLTFADKLNRVPLEGGRFQLDSLVNIPGADPNLKAAYKDGKFVIVGTTPKAQQVAAEFNKDKFVQGSDKTVYADYSGYLPKKAYGGKMLPKYPSGGYFDEITGQWVENTGNPSFEEEDPKVTYAKQRYQAMTDKTPMQNIPILLGKGSYNPQDLELKGNPEIKEIPQYIPNESSNNKVNWSNVATNVGMGLANNAGNIYNLSRYNKPEIERYERLKATLLDPKQALLDAKAQVKVSRQAIKDASGGNAASMLSNTAGLNSKYVQDISRIRQNYDNANAGILNNVNQYNTGLAQQEVIANAMNRARTRSGKGEAIGSMGSNIANQMMDNKEGAMDQKTLQLMMKYYEKYPAFAKMIKEQDWA